MQAGAYESRSLHSRRLRSRVQRNAAICGAELLCEPEAHIDEWVCPAVEDAEVGVERLVMDAVNAWVK